MIVTIVLYSFNYSKARKQELFFVGVPANIQSVVMMFIGQKQDTCILQIDQFTDLLLEQTRQIANTAFLSTKTNRNEKFHQKISVTDTIEEAGSSSLEYISYVTRPPKKSSHPSQRKCCNNNKTHPETHFCACLAKGHRRKTCCYTVCFNKLA